MLRSAAISQATAVVFIPLRSAAVCPPGAKSAGIHTNIVQATILIPDASGFTVRKADLHNPLVTSLHQDPAKLWKVTCGYVNYPEYPPKNSNDT